MTGFTKGPWRVSEIHKNGFYGNQGEAMVSATEDRICAVDCVAEFKRGEGYLTQCAERDANAHLIAAAPELYEALETLTSAVNTAELAAAMANHSVVSFSNVLDAVAVSLDALRKARGEA